MHELMKIAGIQMEPIIMEKEQNLARILELMVTAAKQGAQIIVFPEAALTGYVFRSLEEALPLTETVPGPSTERLLEACRHLNVHVVIGLLEKEKDHYYNTSVLMGPSGLIGKYRKLHLPYLGIDRFLHHGNLPLQVYNTDIGRIGLGICYDLDFPEHARVLTLLGAEVIVTITNWPEGIEIVPEHVVPTRARENRVYQVAVNRVGEERGVRFFGNSKIFDPTGSLLAEGKLHSEDIIFAEVNTALAQEKHHVIIPDELEIDLIKDRRPEFYGKLAKPSTDSSRIRN